jgi:Glycosyl hydrolases family 35/Beta-galactosidase jelly roll domain/Beta-galactosidase, domain 2/Beta-galactosidase, domain 3
MKEEIAQSLKRWLTLACVVAIALNVISINALPSGSINGRDVSKSLLLPRQTTDKPVTYDQHNFYLFGKPFIINSAEMHPWRLPVPGLWRDVLQKLKAGGYNTLSIYTHWGLTTPSNDPSSISLDGPANRLTDFLTIAREVGIFIIVRPGPYINAESTGGGMPGWVQNLEARLRFNSTNWNDAWMPYMKAIVDAAVPFQVKSGGENGALDTSAGTVLAFQVENEFQEADGQKAYFDNIIQFYKDNGVYVPTTYNSIGSNTYVDDFNLDIWGKDAYFQGEDCSNPESWQPLQNWTELSTLRTHNPASIPEFQAGAYDNFGGAGYDKCAIMTNGSFVNVAEKQVYGDGLRFKNDYAGFGGTNWGNTGFGTFVYTSYDYGAGVDESRMIRDKLRASTLLSSFIKSFNSFATTTLKQQGTNIGVSNQSEDIVVSELQQINGTESFYIVRHGDSTASTIATFNLNIEPINGQQITIPKDGKISIVGRDAIIIPVNVALGGSGLVMNYSTSDVSFSSTVGNTDVAILHGQAGYQYEFALSGSGLGTITASDQSIKIQQDSNSATIQWTPASQKAFSVTVPAANGKKLMIRLTDVDYAHAFQFPSTASNTADAVLGQGNNRVVVNGAYHVANATLSGDGSTLALVGQLNGTSTSQLDVIAPEDVKQVTFNGAQPSSSSANDGSLQATFNGASQDALSYEAPSLSGWKYQDSLPEIKSGYVPDSNWVKADLTKTPNAWFGEATTPTVLFADAYGFYSGGAVIWQGRFNASSASQFSSMANKLNVTYYGGQYFATSTFLNDKFVGMTGVSNIEYVNSAFDLSQDQFVDGENVFTVIVDSTGLQEWGSGDVTNVNGFDYPKEFSKMPRGILQFDILQSNGSKTENVTLDWIVTGAQGGEKLIDKVRGPLNEGGLYGERQGWHLPGFDDSQWSTKDPTSNDGGVKGAGVGFYRTSVNLNIPDGYDIPFSVVFDEESKDDSKTWRTLLYVNGWQFGKRFVKFGPQTKFPIPPGVLDPKGQNTIAIAVWSPDENGAVMPQISLQKQGVFVGSVDYSLNNPTYQQVRG